MLTASPVIRSPSARALFLTCAVVTVAIYLWSDHVPQNNTFRMLFAYYDGQAAGGLALILILAALLTRPGWLNRVAGWVSDHTLAIAAGTVVLLSVGSVVVYGNDPFTMDEFVPYLQGQAFAAGHLTTHYPPDLIDWMIPEYFQHHFLEFSPATGAVASNYWPSFALLLVPFIWLGIPWACNPVISGLTLLVVRRLALELFEEREAAGFAVLLTVASPVLFGAGISYYSEPAHLLTDAVYALLLLRPSARKALAAGLVGSISLTLHNPFPHFVFALPWLVWVATRPRGIRLLAWLAAGYLPLSLLLGLGWAVFVHGLPHDSFQLPHRLEDIIGGPDPAAGPTLTWVPLPRVLYARLIGLAKVWAWAVPGLVILACAGAWRMRDDARCRLLAASALMTLIGYLFVGFDQGHGWGFRYFHGAWFVLPLFAAAALTRSRRTESTAATFANDEVRAFITACALLTLIVGVGQRAVQIDGFICAEVNQGPRHRVDDGNVVIYTNWASSYGNVLIHNNPWSRNKVVNLYTHGNQADAAVMQSHFPGMHMIYRDHWGSIWTDKPQDPTTAHR